MSDDNSLGPGFERMLSLFNKALVKIGRPSPTGEGMKRSLEKAGFVNVQVVTKKEPLGIWPRDKRMKRIGAMGLLMLETGLEAYTLAILTRVMGLSLEEALKIGKEALEDVRRKEQHSYCEFYVVFGQKPE